MRVLPVFLMCGLIAGGAMAPRSPEPKEVTTQFANCDDQVVEYEPADEYYPARILIERLPARKSGHTPPRPPNAKESPQRTRWYVLEEPDFMRPGPWNTTITIHGRRPMATGLRVKFLDHASYGVRRAWLNEKLLFVEVSWGRILATDLVLDVEAAKPLYVENADFVQLIQPCKDEEKR